MRKAKVPVEIRNWASPCCGSEARKGKEGQKINRRHFKKEAGGELRELVTKTDTETGRQRQNNRKGEGRCLGASRAGKYPPPSWLPKLAPPPFFASFGVGEEDFHTSAGRWR